MRHPTTTCTPTLHIHAPFLCCPLVQNCTSPSHSSNLSYFLLSPQPYPSIHASISSLLRPPSAMPRTIFSSPQDAPQRYMSSLLFVWFVVCCCLSAVVHSATLQCTISYGCSAGLSRASWYGKNGGTLTYDTVTGAATATDATSITGVNNLNYIPDINQAVMPPPFLPVATSLTFTRTAGAGLGITLATNPADNPPAYFTITPSSTGYTCTYVVGDVTGTTSYGGSEGISNCVCVSGCGLPAVSSSSTSDGAGCSDPYFHGFWNQPYYVHGRAREVYNILSDQHLSLNSRFVFLSHVTCPELVANETRRVHCSSHAGTYFGEFGLTTVSGDRLYIASGSVDVGFHQVTVNGVELAIDQSFGTPPLHAVPHESHTSHAMAPATEAAQSAEHAARLTLYVHRTSARSLIVHAGLYELLIENSDSYVDLVQVKVVDWTALLETEQPSGLMGASWNNSAVMPPAEEQHRERDGALMGCNIASDKFCLAVTQH